MFGIVRQVGGWQKRAAEIEHELRAKIRRGEKVARNMHAEHDESLSFGDHVSDLLADTAGSWRFLLSFFIFMAVWVTLNVIAFFSPWDKYPFILLNLMLSMLAAVQAPVIMMSQNRQESRDRLRAENDYEVNLKAEIEIQELHRKLDELREKHMNDLLQMQEQQTRTLDAIITQLNARPAV